jgi:hypothetical protein
VQRLYDDIISRLGPPLWYDDNGTPRYEAFAVGFCNVYDDHIALLEVACQLCDQRFVVASGYHSDRDRPPVLPHVEADNQSDPWFAAGDFDYGDPPRHDDHAGETMNSVPIRILEFWIRSSARGLPWNREPKYELTFPPNR